MTMERVPGLAGRLPQRWASGRRRAADAMSLDALMEALERGEGKRWGLLEWLHLLRHKSRWDVSHPDRAERTASQIWRVAVDSADLQAQVVARLIDRLCGGEGLPGSMMAVFHRERPLAGAAPLLQDIIAALTQDLVVTVSGGDGVGTRPGINKGVTTGRHIDDVIASRTINGIAATRSRVFSEGDKGATQDRITEVLNDLIK